MNPTFLQSIAAAVRDLVRTGKAVHVTEQTAAECELLAGLPWDGVMYEHPPTYGKLSHASEIADLPRSTMQPIAPADIALGWLLCSKAPLIQGFIVSRETSAMRAAECAELAVICERMQAEPIATITLADARIPVYRGMTGELITHLLQMNGSGATASGTVTLPELGASMGTREGARAAWGFIHEQIRTEHRGIGLREIGSENLIDRYRRELEAM